MRAQWVLHTISERASERVARPIAGLGRKKNVAIDAPTLRKSLLNRSGMAHADKKHKQTQYRVRMRAHFCIDQRKMCDLLLPTDWKSNRVPSSIRTACMPSFAAKQQCDCTKNHTQTYQLKQLHSHTYTHCT